MRCLLFLGLLAAPLAALAQQPDTLDLPPITVEATRATQTAATAPFAVTVTAPPPLAVPVTLDEALASLPGLWIADRENASLGERLSIRGMGWRSAFGVRGVQVLLDGVPLTMPDGQAVLTTVAPSLVRQAELIRGPAATFWGNGSGGALFLSTLPAATDRWLTRLRTFGGTYDTRHVEAEAHGPLRDGQIGAYVGHTRTDGYRSYSRSVTTRARLWGRVPANGGVLRWTAAVADQPVAENPGSLTAEQAADDPRQANARNQSTTSGKASFQGQLGLTWLRDTPLGVFDVTGWALTRQLDNPLPFAYIDLVRSAAGVRLTLTDTQGPWQWGLGIDAGVQDDDRRNFANANGEPSGDATLDQQETVSNLAAFATLSRAFGPLRLDAGIRADRVAFNADDRLTSDGDDSGSRVFTALSPSAGVAVPLGAHTVFANVRSAFETPTTTEIVNRPDGGGGFNPDVDPQRTWGGEVGLRGQFVALGLAYELAAYRMRVTGLLTPFELQNGRTYYTNAGRTRHEGVEAFARWQPVAPWGATVSYTWGRFTFRDADGLTGNDLPGIAQHRVYAETYWRSPILHATLAADATSGFFADDANTAHVDGRLTLKARFAHPGLVLNGLTWQPFAEVHNLLDTDYIGSVVVNGFGGRYYEPAAGRTLRLGLQLKR